MYGVQETNNLQDIGYDHGKVDHSRAVVLEDPELVRIVRLRLLSDPGFPVWDLSYCHGVLKDGTVVPVHLGQQQFSKRTLKGDLISLARAAGRFAKGMGMLSDDVISTMQ